MLLKVDFKDKGKKDTFNDRGRLGRWQRPRDLRARVRGPVRCRIRHGQLRAGAPLRGRRRRRARTTSTPSRSSWSTTTPARSRTPASSRSTTPTPRSTGSNTPTRSTRTATCSLSFYIKDAGVKDDVEVQIDWGDGRPNSVVAVPGTYRDGDLVLVSYTYLDDDPTATIERRLHHQDHAHRRRRRPVRHRRRGQGQQPRSEQPRPGRRPRGGPRQRRVGDTELR